MNDEYKVIKKFKCHGKTMVTVRIGSAAYVISEEEWRKIYGRNHQNRWNKKVDWNRFVPRIENTKKSAS